MPPRDRMYNCGVQVDMERRDREREAVKAAQLEEREAANLASRLQAEARIAAALQTNKVMLEKRRQEFNTKQEQNEERRRCAAAVLHGRVGGEILDGLPRKLSGLDPFHLI